MAARQLKREKLREVIRFLTVQVRKLEVEVRLGRSVTTDDILSHGAEVVVLATGAIPFLPAEMHATGNFVHAEDVISGRATTGKRVLVIDMDGHLRGCGTADLLATQGKHVRLASQQIYVGANVDLKTLYPLYKRLHEQGVELLPLTRFVGWETGKPVIADIFTGKHRRMPDVDTVVWS